MRKTLDSIGKKIISKYISAKLKDNSQYLSAKKECAEKAGERLINYIQGNLSGSNNKKLQELFRIQSNSYYYAKTTTRDIELYRVPSQDEFTSHISVEYVTCEVPLSQLNIKTMIKNTQTCQKIVLRNECRYSHGQLNGVPEAKLYIDSGSLEIAYDRVG